MVWGGEPGCEHEWGAEGSKRNRWGLDKEASEKQVSNRGNAWEISQGQFCARCGAWRGQLGLEPTPELYCEHLVAVLREVKRVLRDDGVLWLNLGDSYTSGGRDNLGPSKPDKNIVLHNAPRAPQPPGLKPKDLVGIPWMVAFALRADGWYLRRDIIWCLSGGTYLYARMQKGERPEMIKDLVRLDPKTVKLWNGEKWTQVSGWSQVPRPEEPLEIELRSGERMGCTAGHKWPTERGLVKASDLRVGDIIKRCTLPEPEPPVNPMMLPEYSVGWFVGIYLAEGSRDSTGTIQIASHTKEENRFEKLKRLARDYHGTCFRYVEGNRASININSRLLSAVIDQYIGGRVARNKHLANACWDRSNRFLWEILEGYLEGDGHYDKKNDRWRLGFTRNYYWERDLRTLCARLGIKLKIKLAWSSIGDKKYPTFRGELRYPSGKSHGNQKNYSEVVAIHKSRARKFWSIGVEDEPHLFALASGILTGNSKPNPMPESVTDRPTSAHEYIFQLTKKSRYYYDADAVREGYQESTIARNEYPKLKGKYIGSQTAGDGGGFNKMADEARPIKELYPPHPVGRNLRSVWTFATQSYKGAHFATFPLELPLRCIRTSPPKCCAKCGAGWERVTEKQKAAVTKPRPFSKPGNEGDRNDVGRIYEETETITLGFRPTCTCYPEGEEETAPAVILDPFAGSGTVGEAALKLGRDFILIEVNPKYAKLIEKRTAAITAPLLPEMV